jgi:hypothetical protein
VTPLPREAVFASMESQCTNVIEHSAQARCALYLGDLYRRLNVPDRSQRWMQYYQQFQNGAVNASAR